MLAIINDTVGGGWVTLIMKHKVHEGGAEDAVEQDHGESKECVRQSPPKRTLCQKCSAEGDSSWQEGRNKDQLEELWAQKKTLTPEEKSMLLILSRPGGRKLSALVDASGEK